MALLSSHPPPFSPEKKMVFPAAAIGLATASIVLGYQIGALHRIPATLQIDIGTPLDEAFDYLTRDVEIYSVTLRDLTRDFSGGVEAVLDALSGLLATGFRVRLDEGGFGRIPALPWSVIAVALTGIVLILRGWGPASLVAGTIFYLLVFGLWESGMLTLASVSVAIVLCVVFGILLGVLEYRIPALERMLGPIYDLMQTFPIFSYLVPMLALFGFGSATALIATVIWSLPPMARVTATSLRNTPAEIVEFGQMAGCSRRQMIWSLMLPACRQSLLLGVNQVVMLVLAMVIVASVIGAGGLGADVLSALKSLQIGKAVEAGLAISLIAISLDRCTRTPKQRMIARSRRNRSLRQHLLILLGCLILLGLVARSFTSLSVWPEPFTITTGQFWISAIDWLNAEANQTLSAIRDFAIIYLMRPVKEALLGLPWFAICVATGLLTWRLCGASTAIVAVLGLFAIAVTGYWDSAMVSLYLVFVSVVIAVFVALPLGMLGARWSRLGHILDVVLDVIQTLPPFVYLIPVVMLFGVGEFPALLAISIYSLAPMTRYTMAGLRQISPQIHEVCAMTGCSWLRRVVDVDLPLAAPHVFLGLNQSVVLGFSMLVITALIGTRGLEQETLRALSQVEAGQGIVAGLGIFVLAWIVDRTLRAAARAMDPSSRAPA